MKIIVSFVVVLIECSRSHEGKEHKHQVSAGSFHPGCFSTGIPQKEKFSYKFLYTCCKPVGNNFLKTLLSQQLSLFCFVFGYNWRHSHNALPSELILSSTEDTSRTSYLRETEPYSHQGTMCSKTPSSRTIKRKRNNPVCPLINKPL